MHARTHARTYARTHTHTHTLLLFTIPKNLIYFLLWPQGPKDLRQARGFVIYLLIWHGGGVLWMQRYLFLAFFVFFLGLWAIFGNNPYLTHTKYRNIPELTLLQRGFAHACHTFWCGWGHFESHIFPPSCEIGQVKLLAQGFYEPESQAWRLQLKVISTHEFGSCILNFIMLE